jgi:PPM family protein phosphatase
MTIGRVARGESHAHAWSDGEAMLRAIETAVRTDTGRQRRGNEDAVFARPPVFVVADGMGGAQAGEVASRIAVETFERGLPPDGTPLDRLVEVTQTANREIHELSHAGDEHAGMGTTLTAALLDDSEVSIAHVGDSRAYLFRDGELVRLTRDHSLVEELMSQGKLTEQQALESPARSIITRALGPEPEVEVDTWTYPLKPDDVLLLCSDGLTSMLSEAQIANILVSVSSLTAAADRMVDEANEAGGRDNITVVLFRVAEANGAAMIDQPTVLVSSASSDAPPADPVVPASARSRAPLARTQGHGGKARGERQLTRFGKFAAAILAACAVLFLFGAGGYLASRQLYFLGTNAQGMVTVYRGFPYMLPFGIRMYETFYVSGVPASLLPLDRRTTLLNHNLRSQSAATKLINDLELGQVSR